MVGVDVVGVVGSGGKGGGMEVKGILLSSIQIAELT